MNNYYKVDRECIEGEMRQKVQFPHGQIRKELLDFDGVLMMARAIDKCQELMRRLSNGDKQLPAGPADHVL